MAKAIIYKSSTGHTEQYAKLLSEKLGIPCYREKEAKKEIKNGEKIIYLGWLCASNISGLKKAQKRYTIECCGAVGIYPEGEEYLKSLKDSNQIEQENFFYLRGGIDYTKLKGIKKKVLQMVGSAMEKENKLENKELISVFKYGNNFVNEANLEPMIQYLKSKK